MKEKKEWHKAAETLSGVKVYGDDLTPGKNVLKDPIEAQKKSQESASKAYFNSTNTMSNAIEDVVERRKKDYAQQRRDQNQKKSCFFFGKSSKIQYIKKVSNHEIQYLSSNGSNFASVIKKISKFIRISFYLQSDGFKSLRFNMKGITLLIN